MSEKLFPCLLLTTQKAHAYMTERHGLISIKGCEAAKGRKFKECQECPSKGDEHG